MIQPHYLKAGVIILVCLVMAVLFTGYLDDKIFTGFGALISLVSGVIGIITVFRNPQNTSQQKQNAQLQSFYQNLAKSANQLDLSIIEESSGEHGAKPALGDIYEDQKVLVGIKRDNDDKAMFSQGEKQASKLLIQALDEADNQKLVLLGKVGSGKSSFVNYLCWQLCQSQLDGKNVLLPKGLRNRPVARLILRNLTKDHNDSEFQDCFGFIKKAIQKDFIKYSGASSDQAFDLYWGELCKRGVILLDGLDEVPKTDGARKHLLEAIENLANSHELSSEAYLIVTSRPHAYTEQTLDAFERWQLSAMDATQIQTFLQHWYRVMKAPKQWSEEDALREANDLFAAISRPGNQHLLSLGDSPLLLTLIAALHYARKKLPDSRADLYDSAVDLLLQRWHSRLTDSKMEDNERAALSLPADELKKSLADLALQVHVRQQKEAEVDRKNIRDISRQEVLGFLGDNIDDSFHPKAMLDFLQFRSGILVASEEAYFKFSHRSFQEYLSSYAIKQSPNFRDLLQQHIETDVAWWQEVFLLMMNKWAGESRYDALNYVNSLLMFEETVDAARINIMLSKAVIEQKWHQGKLNPTFYQPVEQRLQTELQNAMWLEALPIKERADAGRRLGHIGDPRKGVLCKSQGGQMLPDIEWIDIPKGEYVIGSKGVDNDAYGDEKPQYRLSLDGCKLAKYPVTNAQYQCFIDAGGYQESKYWTEAGWEWRQKNNGLEKALDYFKNADADDQVKGWFEGDSDTSQPRYTQNAQWNIANLPVVGVNWHEAVAFCRWLSEQRGREVRLPSEVQWEAAARAGDDRVYPWGKDCDVSRANYADTGLKETSVVGLFSCEDCAFDVADMSGNVWEWTSTAWGKQFDNPDFVYPYSHEDERENVDLDMGRVLRGGSWDDYGGDLRSALRDHLSPGSRYRHIGFRLSLGQVRGQEKD